MAIERISECKEKLEPKDEIEVFCRENDALKVYPFSAFVKYQSCQLELYNEWYIMKEDEMKKLEKVIHLTGFEMGLKFVVLRMPKYPLNFRQYLREHRDNKQLKTLLTDIALGLKELHQLGFVHRDLKPENVMVNLQPLCATLIDFNRAYPLT